MTMSSADFLDQWFETDALKATMSASGIIPLGDLILDIRSPGTAYVLLHHYMGEIDGAFGRGDSAAMVAPVLFQTRSARPRAKQASKSARQRRSIKSSSK